MLQIHQINLKQVILLLISLLSAKKTAAEKINTDIQFQGHIPAEIENVIW